MRSTTRAIPRSFLYTPALSLERVLTARSYDADVHLIDLEDSVPAPAKEEARAICRAALDRAGDARNLAVRINPVGTVDHVRDVALLTDGTVRPGYVFMTMVRFPSEPLLLRECLASAGWSPEIFVTVETVEAVHDLDAVAGASDGLILGSADLAATLGIDINPTGLLATRQAMALACARHRTTCVDTGNFQLADPSALHEEIAQARALGFHGKGTVHPKELDAINAAFRPSPQEMAEARTVVDAVRAAGDGVTLVDGRMVGPPFVRRARETLGRGEAWQARFGTARPGLPATP
ncbi:CoA ester lyase [Streptomyces chumphonensis]|uniref:CoA ester lyase n=1 Tax=Streptomyces chumphonensis TaxID=1214925 RepID=A0A927EWD0_9ACTN|nr:aldolase/citrate lyase family protein [Streptomyces chumphonensis]MBD3930605.1 CoA ester lyase [Streptomyces chumphonensis]